MQRLIFVGLAVLALVTSVVAQGAKQMPVFQVDPAFFKPLPNDWVTGQGSAVAVDKHDHVMVPPEHPAYRIRRVWLSKEEEQGYYFGFANEGLWPLWHIAHTRPTFRTQD